MRAGSLIGRGLAPDSDRRNSNNLVVHDDVSRVAIDVLGCKLWVIVSRSLEYHCRDTIQNVLDYGPERQGCHHHLNSKWLSCHYC